MIALYVFLLVLLFIFILLLIPLRFCFHYGDEMHLKLCYLFLSFKLLPQKELIKKQKPKNKGDGKKKTPPKKESSAFDKIKSLIKKKGARAFLSLMKELLVLFSGYVKQIIKHMKIKKIDIYFLAASEDAASAAILFGEASAIIYPVVSALIPYCKDYGVTVDVDYAKSEPTALADAKISILPLFLLKEGLKLLIKGIPFIKELT